MRSAAALITSFCLVAFLAAGCGASPHATVTVTTTRTAATLRLKTAPAGLSVGVTGRLPLEVPGASIRPVSLDALGGQALVLVTRGKSAALVAAAAAHAQIHFALIGRSARALHLANVTGIVLRDDQAVRLGGAIAALSAAEEGGRSARVAWVGPDEPLVDQFVRGVHDAVPHAVVLRAWSPSTPASCKEAALGAIDRGATVVMARGGLCADAAIEGAHQQNHPGLQLSDFELPSIAAEQVVRAAVAGIYHGGEDVVFGARSGAIAVRTLDPRISPQVAVRARAAAQELANGLRPTG
ncbi:MAG TPA: hypothetical protein VIJ70_02620 [Gaiellaceae bacterium]